VMVHVGWDTWKLVSFYPFLSKNQGSKPALMSGQEKNLVSTSGIGWTINQVLAYPKYECKWLDFIATSGKKSKFFGHSEPDGITSAIASNGRIPHCNVLPKLWEKAEKDTNSIYFEIGANIGSCVMEMLLSTDANIVLFEPHPKNLFCIKNTVSALENGYQHRVVIIPVALGAASGTNTVFAAKGNMGNSIVGKVVKDNEKQEFSKEDQHQIHVEPLHSIVSSKVTVPLVKMDVQGFECQILSGINQELANAIHFVKFEVSPKHLRSQGCEDLLARFREKGFDITTEDGRHLSREWHQFHRSVELYAVRKHSSTKLWPPA